MWRPLVSEPPLCTLLELQTVYSIDDLAQMHATLDEIDEMRAQAMKARP